MRWDREKVYRDDGKAGCGMSKVRRDMSKVQEEMQKVAGDVRKVG